VINGLDAVPVPAYALHAGTAARDGEVVSSGGRVLSITASAPTLQAARDAAYAGVAEIRLDGAHHRSDIALKALRSEIVVPT